MYICARHILLWVKFCLILIWMHSSPSSGVLLTYIIGTTDLLPCTVLRSLSSIKNLLMVLFAKNDWYHRPHSECICCIQFTKFHIYLSVQDLSCKRNSGALKDVVFNLGLQENKHAVYQLFSCIRTHWVDV